MFKWIRYLVAALGLTGLLGISPTQAADEPADLVAAAQKTFADMQNDPDMTWFAKHLHEAKGILILQKS